MKTLSVAEAQGQLPQLVAEALDGETIVLRDGDRAMTLSPGSVFDWEGGGSELEAELLKAADGPFTPYSSEEMRAIGERIVREHRAAPKK